MDKVVFITGASSGIGRATALAFAQAGYQVAGTARRAEKLESLAQEINTMHGSVGQFLPLVGDVANPQSLIEATQKTMDTFGRLDILVANAGVGHRGSLVDSDWDGLETLLRTNIDGVLHSIRACVPHMRATGGGHIMTISSVQYNLIAPYSASYAASKAFVTSIANSIRIELEADHIKVSDFLVGRTNSEFNDKRLGDGARKGGGLPTMSPDDVAKAIVQTAIRPKNTVILRFFDRLIVLGNRLVPSIIGALAKRQYK
ncbi:MAG: SDR family NAD(P)-dependent oxidoreductase [Phototrophicaceae bacterium]